MKSKKYIVISILVLLGFLLASTSCSSRYYVSTDTFGDPQALPVGFSRGSSFAVLSKETENPLFVKEVGYKIENMLKRKGYLIKSESEADFILSFAFDSEVSTETVQVEKILPSTTEKVKTRFHPKDTSFHYNVNWDGKGNVAESLQYSEEKEKPGKTVYVPETRTYFTKNLSMKVYDGKLFRNSQSVEVWNGSSMSKNSCDDLREMIDYFLVSAFRHFGRNTFKKVEVAISKDDEEVKEFQEGLQVRS